VEVAQVEMVVVEVVLVDIRTSFPGGTKLTITKGSSTPVTVGAGGAGHLVRLDGNPGSHFNIFNNYIYRRWRWWS
jgi:hypothetical protein